MQTKTKQNLFALCESGIMIALATILSFFEIQVGANGGSINFAMLPLLVLSYRRGVLWSLPAGCAFGLIKCLIGGAIGWGLPSVLLDYVLAYGAVGLCGIFKGKKWAIELGSFIGCFARYVITVLSGVLIWTITVPTEVSFFGVIADPLLYSILYNLIPILPSSIVCIALMSALRPALSRLEKLK